MFAVSYSNYAHLSMRPFNLRRQKEVLRFYLFEPTTEKAIGHVSLEIVLLSVLKASICLTWSKHCELQIVHSYKPNVVRICYPLREISPNSQPKSYFVDFEGLKLCKKHIFLKTAQVWSLLTLALNTAFQSNNTGESKTSEINCFLPH